MSELRNIRIVAAVIEIDGEVLLVKQQGPTDPEPAWAFPGGRVEPGESLVTALKRELREETGLTLDERSPVLAYVCETVDVQDATHAIVFVFRAKVLADRAPVSDPDGFVQEARFVPVADAITYLDAHPYLTMREPTSSCLRGGDVSFWSYAVSPLGTVERILP